jgi:hypothetical protein
MLAALLSRSRQRHPPPATVAAEPGVRLIQWNGEHTTITITAAYLKGLDLASELAPRWLTINSGRKHGCYPRRTTDR